MGDHGGGNLGKNLSWLLCFQIPDVPVSTVSQLLYVRQVVNENVGVRYQSSGSRIMINETLFQMIDSYLMWRVTLTTSLRISL